MEGILSRSLGYAASYPKWWHLSPEEAMQNRYDQYDDMLRDVRADALREAAKVVEFHLETLNCAWDVKDDDATKDRKAARIRTAYYIRDQIIMQIDDPMHFDDHKFETEQWRVELKRRPSYHIGWDAYLSGIRRSDSGHQLGPDGYRGDLTARFAWELGWDESHVESDRKLDDIRASGQ
jgi:hypothetical protein